MCNLHFYSSLIFLYPALFLNFKNLLSAPKPNQVWVSQLWSLEIMCFIHHHLANQFSSPIFLLYSFFFSEPQFDHLVHGTYIQATCRQIKSSALCHIYLPTLSDLLRLIPSLCTLNFGFPVVLYLFLKHFILISLLCQKLSSIPGAAYVEGIISSSFHTPSSLLQIGRFHCSFFSTLHIVFFSYFTFLSSSYGNEIILAHSIITDSVHLMT